MRLRSKIHEKVFLIGLLIALFMLVVLYTTKAHGSIVSLKNAINFLSIKTKINLPQKRIKNLAKLFSKYGRMWKVDPFLAISIACQESHFRDRPKKLRLKKCNTVIAKDKAIEVCEWRWPGERGLMQIIPIYARDSFTACKGRSWNSPDELYDTETNICVGMHLLAKRRRKIQQRLKRGWYFKVKYGRWGWQKKFKPCGRRQRRFCQRNAKLCARHWWIASWNWGTHRVYCNNGGRFDFAGYPIKVLKRYKLITSKFKKQTKVG